MQSQLNSQQIFCKSLQKIILKFIWKCEETKVVKTILKSKNTVGSLTLRYSMNLNREDSGIGKRIDTQISGAEQIPELDLLQWEFLIIYFHSLEKFLRNNTWKNSIYQETVLMIIFHVFLRIIALLQTPRPDPEGSMIGIMKAWSLEHRVGVRHEHCLRTC